MVDDMKKMQEEQFKKRSATKDPSPRIAAQALKSVQGMRSGADEPNMGVSTMGSPSDFKEFLRNLNLAEYFDRFAELGFREMHSLQVQIVSI